MVISNSDEMREMTNISQGRRPLVRGGIRNIGNRGVRHPSVQVGLRNVEFRGGRRPLVRGGLRNSGNMGRISIPPTDGSILRGLVSLPLNAALVPRGLLRFPNPLASTASQRGTSVGVRHASSVAISEPPNQSEFRLEMIDPANYTIYELLNTVRSRVPRPQFNNVLQMFLKYSLIIHNFPPCQMGDLMIAVYLFLEEKFRATFRMVTCVRRNLLDSQSVGVVFERIQSVEVILREAETALRDSPVTIIRNSNPALIFTAIRVITNRIV